MSGVHVSVQEYSDLFTSTFWAVEKSVAAKRRISGEAMVTCLLTRLTRSGVVEISTMEATSKKAAVFAKMLRSVHRWSCGSRWEIRGFARML